MFVGGHERGKTALTFKPVRKIEFFYLMSVHKAVYIR